MGSARLVHSFENRPDFPLVARLERLDQGEQIISQAAMFRAVYVYDSLARANSHIFLSQTRCADREIGSGLVM
jgi:hypothetical protein